MNNPLRMEYMHLLPWRRSGRENGDEEMGLEDDNMSECESHYHGYGGHQRGSAYSLNEGDLRILGLLREETGSNDEAETGVKFSGSTINQRLMMAIEEKDTGAMEFCLRSGADPNTQFGTNKVTALHLATTIGAPETIQILLKNGVDVKVADSRGITPLHLAAGLGLADIVMSLITAGADINAQDLIRENGGGQETSLHRAAIGGHLDALRKLLLAGAKVDMVEHRGRTPLQYAAQRGATGCIQALLDFKADPNHLDKQGASALLLLGGGYLMKGHRRATGYNESIEVLIAGGAKVNVKDPNSGVTPLHQAVMLGRIDSTRTLLAAGAEINAQDAEGGTAMHACALKGHSSILKLLLAQPNSVDVVNLADSKGRMPLHKAAYRGASECIQLLLKAGADLGAKTNAGSSAATLILQSPNGTKILSKRLDESIITNGVDPSEIACRVTFDYSILLSKHKYQQMGVIEDILDDKRQRLTADLFQHPVIESFLCLKWRKIRLLFFSNVIFYMILVAGVTAYVLSTVSTHSIQPEVPQNTSGNESGDWVVASRTTAIEISKDLRLRMLLNIIILIIILQEVIQFASLHYQYFREAESWIKLVALITSTIVIFSAPPWAEWVHHISAVAVLFGWTEVTLLLGRLPTFGVYALMFYSVAQHLVKFIFVFFFFLAGFAFSFFLLFNKIHDTSATTAFDTPWTALLRTFAMMLGDTSYDDYMVQGSYNLDGTAHVIYFFFLVLVSLILMNLLIGLAVNDIQGLQIEGRVKRLRKQAEFIVYLEDIASNRILHFFLCCCSGAITKRTNTWINQEPVYSFYPARRKVKIALPANVVERVVTIVQEGRAPEIVTANETYSLLQECAASIGSLRMRIESLERGLVGPLGAAVDGSGSTETIELGGNLGKPRLISDSNDGSGDSAASEKDTPDLSQDEDQDGEDHVDGAYSRKGMALSRRTTMRTIRTVKTMKSTMKSSIRSEINEIKEMLIKLTSKNDQSMN